MDKTKIITFFLMVILSCRSREEAGIGTDYPESSPSIIIQKLDSIKIDFLGNPTVHDIDPKSGTILFMEHKESSQEIYIVNFKGQILSSFSKFGNIPDTYGALMGNVSLLDGNKFLVYGYNGFLTFDLEGGLQSLVRYNDFQVPSQSKISMGFGMEKLDHRFIFIHQAPPPQELDLYKDYKLMMLLDPEKGTRQPIIEFPKGSRFLNGNYYFLKSWFPVYTIDKDRLFVSFGVEPVIYVYESYEPFGLLDRIPLDLINFSEYHGTEDPRDIRVLGMPFVSGRIENIKKVEGLLLVAYFPGYKDSDIELNFENLTVKDRTIFQERMRKKYQSRIAIIDSTGNVLKDFVPDGLVAESMLFRKGELWMMEKPDEEIERDFFRLFRVGLKLEN